MGQGPVEVQAQVGAGGRRAERSGADLPGHELPVPLGQINSLVN